MDIFKMLPEYQARSLGPGKALLEPAIHPWLLATNKAFLSPNGVACHQLHQWCCPDVQVTQPIQRDFQKAF
jgi:hypothetical protein